ncbi:hypothetical protein GALMADRAFT_223656 [Galerina marginata CBS 339.88]|uniref:DUF6535 domain-containing protein n=1 Tax=Galerina marginata (strain CBS 339.88) TaxID=685588 RepID=A0A067THN9_GALM3|nr:hypothetical protein GALMADRAFT_223656 [Galerina marginata CBS 339.88]
MCDAWKEEADKLLNLRIPTDVSVRLLGVLASQATNSTVLSNLLANWDAVLPHNPHKAAVALRQMRYEELLYDRVPDIFSILPILLQSSLVVSFIALLDLLWTRHTLVAGCVTAAVGVAMLFLAATTALPTLQHGFTKDKHLRVKQCPYKSPESWQLFYCTGHTLFWFRDADEVTRGTARKLKDSDRRTTWYMACINAVYPIYHGLADLEVSTAATTISGFYLGGQINNTTLRVMLDDRFSPAEEQKCGILSAYYLRLHQDAHPVLKNSYIEAVIRILNSQEVPQPFYDWLSEILQELASTSPSSSNASASLSLLNPEINVQLLLCVKMVMPRKYGLHTHDIVVAWALLHRLLSLTLIASQEDRGLGAGPGVNVNHLKLACGMFEEFEQWITCGKEISQWDSVKLCTEGMLTLFLPSVDLVWLENICPDMSKALSLLHALEVHVAMLGGPAGLLLHERWWLNYWEVFTEKDWHLLLEIFEVLAEE